VNTPGPADTPGGPDMPDATRPPSPDTGFPAVTERDVLAALMENVDIDRLLNLLPHPPEPGEGRTIGEDRDTAVHTADRR
jgi:hypothetical protein